MYLLGLDIGTTSCKAMLFAVDGKVMGRAYEEYSVIFDNGFAEQDPEQIWYSVKSVIRKATEQIKCKKDIKAIAASVQGDAVFPIDSDYKVLHNAILGMDYRAVDQAEKCKRLFGDFEIFKRTGMRPHPLNSFTKALWIKENLADVHSRTYKYVTFSDYIVARLGAEPRIDITMASRSMAFEIKTKAWMYEMFEKTDMNPKLFSEIVESGVVLGKLGTTAATELGLPTDTLIVSGAHDQVCAAIGAGVIEDGIALDSHGTAEVLSTSLSKPLLGQAMYDAALPCYYHAKSDIYFTFALNHTGGILLKWFAENLCDSERKQAADESASVYEILDKKLPDNPTKLLFLPHFRGSGTPTWDVNSKGAIIGLDFLTTRYVIAKAIIEGLAYELRNSIECFSKVGIEINKIRAVGGAAKSKVSMQIKADVLGCQIETLQICDSACLGAAMLAGLACGFYTDINDAVARTVKIAEVHSPDPVKSKIYSENYLQYKKLYPALVDISANL